MVGDVTDANYTTVAAASPLQVAHLCALAAVTAGGVASNALVLLLFWRRPSLRSLSNRFVLNLCATHLAQCLLPLPAAALSAALGRWPLGNRACHAAGAATTALNATATAALLLIALDRHRAVAAPLHYTTTALTRRRSGALIGATWLLGAAAGAAAPPVEWRPAWRACAPRFDSAPAYGAALLALGFAAPFFTTCALYGAMFRAARHSSRKHSIDQGMGESRRRWSSGSNHLFGGEEWKAARTGLLVVASFALCWFPFFGAVAAEALAPPGLPAGAAPWTQVLAAAACLVNPYLYVFRNEASRQQARQLLRNKRWAFQQQGGGSAPCALAASLEVGGVKALPCPPAPPLPSKLLFRLTRDSSSDTENASLESDPPADPTPPHRRRGGIGRFLFNTSEEGETPTPHLSSFGSARRKSFIHSHARSSETTLTTSSSAETTTSSRPRLVRQLHTTEMPPPSDDLPPPPQSVL